MYFAQDLKRPLKNEENLFFLLKLSRWGDLLTPGGWDAERGSGGKKCKDALHCYTKRGMGGKKCNFTPWLIHIDQYIRKNVF